MWGPDAGDPATTCRPLAIDIYAVRASDARGLAAAGAADYQGAHGLAYPERTGGALSQQAVRWCPQSRNRTIAMANDSYPPSAPFAALDPAALRREHPIGKACRTHGRTRSDGFVQANVCILPKAWADEFLLFCQRNPKPCPLLAVSDPGDPRLPGLGNDLDIRTDVPGYCVFRDGEADRGSDDITHLWRDDFVTFALGCSFSFESALIESGSAVEAHRAGTVRRDVRHQCRHAPAGRLHGKLVVSMRPVAADAIRAIQITSRFPSVHGAPVHLGTPELIGIDDLRQAYLGIGLSDVAADELPVFWACGVTPHSVIQAARPPIWITHKPGHMLITDLRIRALHLSESENRALRRAYSPLRAAGRQSALAAARQVSAGAGFKALDKEAHSRHGRSYVPGRAPYSEAQARRRSSGSAARRSVPRSLSSRTRAGLP